MSSTQQLRDVLVAISEAGGEKPDYDIYTELSGDLLGSAIRVLALRGYVRTIGGIPRITHAGLQYLGNTDELGHPDYRGRWMSLAEAAAAERELGGVAD